MELMTITAAAIMSMYMSAAHSSNNDFRYNADIQDGRVKTQYVYRETGNELTPRLRYDYAYDEHDRIASRTTYLWNGLDWQPAARWSYSYTPSGYAVELSRWNAVRRRFDGATAKTVYTFAPDATAAYVTSFARRDDRSDYKLTDSLLAAYPQAVGPDLLAEHR